MRVFWLSLGMALFFASNAEASGLRTHLWVGQRILDALGKGCDVEISGKSVEVPADVCRSIREHPDDFLAGTLGPDVFPDLIAGQVTMHPGIEGDWQTSEWLRHVYETADAGPELAFAAGYVVHAASDVLAHTYVNMYAGDVFELGDERAVELRHFVLEKYIDYHLPDPPVAVDRLGVPANFLRDRLLYGPDVLRLARKAGTAPHIVAMNEVRDEVDSVARRLDRLEEEAGKAAALLITESVKIQAELISGEATLKVAEEAAKIGEQSLEIERRSYDEAYAAYQKARDAYDKNMEGIRAAELQAKIARDGIEASRKALSDLADGERKASQELSDLRHRIASVPSNLAENVCREIKKFCGPFSVFCGFFTKCDLVEKANPLYRDLIDRIHDAERNIADMRSRAQAETANIAAMTMQEANALQIKANLELETGALKAVDATATAAYEISKAKLDAQADALENARMELARVRDELAKLRAQLIDVNSLKEKLQKLVAGSDVLSWYAKNWRNGIEVAGREYMLTALDVGKRIASGDQGVMSSYGRWLTCYGSTFASTPYQLGEFGCAAEDAYRGLQDKLEALVVDALPPPLDWLYKEYIDIRTDIVIQLKRKVDDATIALAKLISPDKTTAEFIEVLIRPENATRDKLNQVFSVNENADGKELLVFENVASFIDRDMGMRNDVLDIDEFAALRHGLLFSKMALLDDDGLRKLVWLMGEDPDRIQIRNKGRRYTMLYQSLRSIDGNHQWQPYGLPYPRLDGQPQPGDALRRNFGYGPANGSGMGFPLFMDAALRNSVFARIFDGNVAGALSEHPMLSSDRYPFPGCAGYYPVTFDAAGRPVAEDKGCADMARRLPERAKILEFWRGVLSRFGYRPKHRPQQAPKD